MNPRTCLVLAAVLGLTAVLAGAFGAHGLSDSGYLAEKYAHTAVKDVAGLQLPASYKYFTDFQTGVRYHMWHALAMLATGIFMLWKPSRLLSAAAICFFAGTLLFSGSLYLLVIAGPRAGGIPWGMVAPIGGTLLLVGWLLLGVAVAGTDFSQDQLHDASAA